VPFDVPKENNPDLKFGISSKIEEDDGSEDPASV